MLGKLANGQERLIGEDVESLWSYLKARQWFGASQTGPSDEWGCLDAQLPAAYVSYLPSALSQPTRNNLWCISYTLPPIFTCVELPISKVLGFPSHTFTGCLYFNYWSSGRECFSVLVPSGFTPNELLSRKQNNPYFSTCFSSRRSTIRAHSKNYCQNRVSQCLQSR